MQIPLELLHAICKGYMACVESTWMAIIIIQIANKGGEL